MARRPLVLLNLAIAGVLAIAVSGAQGSTDARAGGIFKITFLTSLGAFDHVDPALAYSRESWALLDTVCARLMRYRDKPPPAGYQLVPEVAAAPPTMSADGRTWTVRLRSGFRFSNGQPVRANAFEHAIYRTMAPGIDSPGYAYTRAIIGAEDVRAGRARRASGVVTRGNTLRISFTREVPEFPAWTTMPFFCAVPPTLPPSPEGVRTFPGSGPYVITKYSLGRQIEIRRNRHYGGNREHHVDGFDVDLRAEPPDVQISRVVAGAADWTYALSGVALSSQHNLMKTFGLNKSRFWLTPGLTVSMYVLNSSGPLFRDNPQLRRAVNLALNRETIMAPGAGYPTDQLLPPSVFGFKERAVYPDQGNLARARELAAGNLRAGKAVLYVPDIPLTRSSAQRVQLQLKQIDLEVEIRPFGEHVTASSYLGRLAPEADEPWDLALMVWAPDFVDPAAYVNRLLDAQHASGTNLARFDEPPYNQLMRAAARLQGAARAKGYAELDLRLTHDAAPVVPVFVFHETTFVSARVDPKCMLRRPGLVLTTVCLKPSGT